MSHFTLGDNLVDVLFFIFAHLFSTISTGSNNLTGHNWRHISTHLFTHVDTVWYM